MKVGSQLSYFLNRYVQGFQVLTDGALRPNTTKVLHQKSRTAFLWEREGVETHTVFPIKGPGRTIAALNSSEGDGKTNFSLCSCAINPPGQDARNQATKEHS